jgi:hypothetical protein
MILTASQLLETQKHLPGVELVLARIGRSRGDPKMETASTLHRGN